MIQMIKEILKGAVIIVFVLGAELVAIALCRAGDDDADK